MTEYIETARDWLTRPEAQAVLVILVAFLLAKVVDFVICRMLRVLTRKTTTDLDDKLIGLLHRPIFLTVVLVGLHVAAGLIFAAPREPGLETWLYLFTTRVIETLILLMWTGASLRISSLVLSGLGKLADRVTWLDARTVPLFDNLARVLLIGFALYGFLLIWALDVKPWLASAGIVGLAVGLAAQDSLANLFAGLSLILDAPYKIGDYINLESGDRGEVTKIGLRSTRILNRDDLEITIPNAQIAGSKIVNESSGRWIKSRVRARVGVAYGSDLNQVREVLMQAAYSVEQVLHDPEPRVRFREMADSSLNHELLCWIGDPVQRGQVLDALNRAIYDGLREADITIPFPQRDVHVHQIA